MPGKINVPALIIGIVIGFVAVYAIPVAADLDINQFVGTVV